MIGGRLQQMNDFTAIANVLVLRDNVVSIRKIQTLCDYTRGVRGIRMSDDVTTFTDSDVFHKARRKNQMF